MLSVEQREQIINDVLGWLNAAPTEEREAFIDCDEPKLIRYHHTLGQDIRNEFNLWNHPWDPVIVNGCDESPHHPDSVSHQIIIEVWKRAKASD